MSAVLVVGTVAFDSIETPHGVVDDALGGSATFFSYAASFFVKPRLVGVVGEDFPGEFRRLLADRQIDTGGLVTEPGKTFRWKGRYHADMNNRDTLEVHLNVFGTFDPVVPDSFRDSDHVFLANGSGYGYTITIYPYDESESAARGGGLTWRPGIVLSTASK